MSPRNIETCQAHTSQNDILWHYVSHLHFNFPLGGAVEVTNRYNHGKISTPVFFSPLFTMAILIYIMYSHKRLEHFNFPMVPVPADPLRRFSAFSSFPHPRGASLAHQGQSVRQALWPVRRGVTRYTFKYQIYIYIYIHTYIHYITLHCIALHYITLHYIALHYIALHCITLHCITLHYITLHYIALHYITLHYVALHYFTLHYIALHCITLHYIALHYITLHCIALHYITLHCIALHYIALHCITLHCIALHYITLHCITYIHTYNITYIHITFDGKLSSKNHSFL